MAVAQQKAIRGVRALENKLISIKAPGSDESLKILSTILKQLQSKDPKIIFASSKILERFFLKDSQQESHKRKATEEVIYYQPENGKERSLRGYYTRFIEFLFSSLPISPVALQMEIIKSIMNFIKIESQRKFSAEIEQPVGQFAIDSTLLTRLLEVLIKSPNQEEVLEEFCQSYFLPFEDVAYGCMLALRTLSKQNQSNTNTEENDNFARGAYKLIRCIRIPPEEGTDTWVPDSYITPKAKPASKKQKKTTEEEQSNGTSNSSKYPTASEDFTEAWLEFLRLSLPMDVFKKVLVRMHTDVIPLISDPILIVDFLNNSFNTGGVISLLALNSIFSLMVSYNLSYPNFYTKLYSMFEPLIFQAKYCSRFFVMAKAFLSSSYLSSNLVCSFIKKVARLSLQASPMGVMTCLSFIYELMQKHPSARVLIQRTVKEKDFKPILLIGMNPSSVDTSSDIKEVAGFDQYDSNEVDPDKSNAANSSLWEIKVLQNHYNLGVRKYVEIFEGAIDLKTFPIEDTLDRTYQELFEAEIHKGDKKKINAALADHLKGGLISEDIKELWSF